MTNRNTRLIDDMGTDGRPNPRDAATVLRAIHILGFVASEHKGEFIIRRHDDAPHMAMRINGAREALAYAARIWRKGER